MGPAITILTPHMKKKMKMLKPENIFMLEILKNIATKKIMLRGVPYANLGQQNGVSNAQRY